MHARETPSRFPPVRGSLDAPLSRAIEACHAGAEACIDCADASLDDPAAIRLGRCIHLALSCAEACSNTGFSLARRRTANAALLRQMVETCADLCQACAAECDRHGVEFEHCRLCGEACRTCETACRDTAMALGSTGS